MYATEGKTQSEIAKILSAEGVPTKSDGKKNYKQKIRNSEGFWRQDNVSKMLNRTEYIGKYFYGKTTTITDANGKKHTVPNDPENMVELSCPAILDDASLFERAQEMLEQNKKLTRSKEKDKHMLA